MGPNRRTKVVDRNDESMIDAWEGFVGMDLTTDRPILFMWGNLSLGLPRKNDTIFFDRATWFPFVESTGGDQGRVVEVNGDHWFFHQSPKFVNTQMSTWLDQVRMQRMVV